MKNNIFSPNAISFLGDAYTHAKLLSMRKNYNDQRTANTIVSKMLHASTLITKNDSQNRRKKFLTIKFDILR